MRRSFGHQLPSECPRFVSSLPTLDSLIEKVNDLETAELVMVRDQTSLMREHARSLYSCLHDRVAAIACLDKACEAEYNMTGDCKIFGEIATAFDVKDTEWPSEVEPVGK
jgi:hypothetical protein